MCQLIAYLTRAVTGMHLCSKMLPAIRRESHDITVFNVLKPTKGIDVIGQQHSTYANNNK